MKLSTKTLVALFGFGVLSAAVSAGGCGGGSGASSEASSGSSGSGGGGAGDGTSTGAAGGDSAASGFGVGGGPDVDGPPDEDSACVAEKLQANYEQRPADIIFVIDNSGSMTEEIESVQRNINANFASIIERSGIDYRVIMLSQHGSAALTQSICVEAPLGAGSCTPVPATPTNNPPHFFHYNLEVGSLDSLCLILDSVKGGIQPRGSALPNGWSEWLRPDSLKVFVEVTDDNAGCTTKTIDPPVTFADNGAEETAAEGAIVAESFDRALTSLAPELFGTPEARNYMFFSFVGVKSNSNPSEPHPPTSPVLEGYRGQCPDAVGPGTGYQTLSVLTGGLRYPVCNYDMYDPVFQAIADSVISGAKLSCEVVIPEAPNGHTIDLETVQIEFSPSNGGEPETFVQVDNIDACQPKAFYIEERVIKLCPDTCVFARQDDAAQMDLLYGCTADPL